jgi:hypothetical protein
MDRDKQISLAMRSALARRDYWVEQRTLAEVNKDAPGIEKAQRFIEEYDALIAVITSDCPE